MPFDSVIDSSGRNRQQGGMESDLRAVAGSLFRRFLLAEAAHHARLGRFTRATEILEELTKRDNSSAAEFDMLARVYAQQGRLPEARSAWERAAELNPLDPRFASGLRRIESILAKPTRSRIPTRGLIWLATLIVSAFLLFLVFSSIGNEIASLKNETARLAETADGLLERRSSAALRTAAPAVAVSQEPLELDLALPGIVTTKEGEGCLLIFESGLFSRADILSDEAGMLLAALGGKLAARIRELSIEVVGHTDDIRVPPESGFRDNTDLAFARAVAAAEQISAGARIPLALLSIRCGAENMAPYPNDNDENRFRNRTVTIRISKFKND